MGAQHNDETPSGNRRSVSVTFYTLLNKFAAVFIPDEHILSFLRTDWTPQFSFQEQTHGNKFWSLDVFKSRTRASHQTNESHSTRMLAL